MEIPTLAPAGMTPEIADRKARIFVCGMRQFKAVEGHPDNGKMVVASGQWSSAFSSHPWVQKADAEGWATDLRLHCIRVARRQIGLGLPYDVAGLMPSAEVIAKWRANAERYCEAEQWREDVIASHGDVKNFLNAARNGGVQRRGSRAQNAGEIALDWTRAQRPGFKAIQQDSPNRGLHLTKEGVLSETSKRMAGDRE